MDPNGRTRIDDHTVSVYSPHDGGYYAEQHRHLVRGSTQFRVTKQVWPTHDECKTAVLNKKACWKKYK